MNYREFTQSYTLCTIDNDEKRMKAYTLWLQRKWILTQFRGVTISIILNFIYNKNFNFFSIKLKY